MRFALWTCCLIFAENFLLSYGYPEDRTLEINSYSDNRKPAEIFSNREDESATTHKLRFAKLNSLINEKFGNDLITYRIRHEKHGNNIHEKSKYNHFKSVAKESQELNEVRKASEKITARFEHTANKESEEKMLNDENYWSATSLQKIQTLGNSEKVNELFKLKYGVLPNSVKISEDEQKFLKHYEEMKRRTACSIPTPKIVKVDEVHPDVFKNYFPSCTVIHQCSEDSGCCPKGKVCAPLKTENVTLHFKAAIRSSGTKFPRNVYETLSFINHTECSCTSQRNRVVRHLPSTPSTNVETSTQNIDISYAKRCQCPTPFSVRFMADGTCACDCYDKQHECLRFKRGLESFSPKDMFCIISKQCAHPTCNFGDYMSKYGRCPQIYEKHFPE